MNDKASSRMELRGKLDSLNAQIILLQAMSDSHEYIADLEEFREIVRKLQRCEACGEVFADRMTLWGLDEEELHAHSHSPAKYYGLGHISPHHEMGRKSAELNVLRTLIRETELCAVRVYGDEDVQRICHVLNRLSSALYILTYKYLPEGYNRTIKFGFSE